MRSTPTRPARPWLGSRRAIAVLVAIAGVLTACGGDDGESANAPVDPAERQAAEEWMAAVCGSILEWQDAIGVLAEEGEPESRAEFVTFFTGSVEATSRLVEELEAASVPDVQDGEDAAATYVRAFTRALEVSSDARERAEELPDEITEEERTELEGIIQEGYGEISDTFAEAGERVDSPALEEAFAANPDCAAVS